MTSKPYDPYGRAPIIVGFGHRAGVGKDAAALALEPLGYERLGFADTLKSIAYAVRPEWQPMIDEYGWDSVKRLMPDVRQFLQLLGTEGVRDHLGEDVWVDACMAKMQPGHKYVVTDVRFPNEAKAILRAGGHLYRIDRPGRQSVQAHLSEEALASWDGWSGTFTNSFDSLGSFQLFVQEYVLHHVEGK